MSQSCNNCRYAIYEDYGYSNYTVEGTEFSCAIGAHPDGSFDRWFRESPLLAYGSTCPKHEDGEPIDMDVECENINDLNEEQKTIWLNRV